VQKGGNPRLHWVTRHTHTTDYTLLDHPSNALPGTVCALCLLVNVCYVLVSYRRYLTASDSRFSDAASAKILHRLLNAAQLQRSRPAEVARDLSVRACFCCCLCMCLSRINLSAKSSEGPSLSLPFSGRVHIRMACQSPPRLALVSITCVHHFSTGRPL
jgi:hypothetical protein